MSTKRDTQLVMLTRWQSGLCMRPNCAHTPTVAASLPGTGNFAVACPEHVEPYKTRPGWVYGDICPFCRGSGFLPRLAHIDKGVCYRCNGSGVFGAKLGGAK